MRNTAFLSAAAAVAAIVVTGVGSAIGADGSVEATSGNKFTPETVTINVGEKVTFTNSGGFHNVNFDDGEFKSPDSASPTPWTAERTFKKAGTYLYFCDAHGSKGGNGMSGKVVVVDPSAPSSTPPAPLEATSVTFTAKAASSRFCSKRASNCPRPGARIRFDVSEATKVTATVKRRASSSGSYKRFGTLRFNLAAGKSTVLLPKTTSGRRLPAGEYRISFAALGETTAVRFAMR